MAKPIVVLYLPSVDSFGFDLTPGDLMSMLNDNDEQRKMAPMFYDYLWFVFINGELVAPELKVFHEKEYTKEQYDDLKKMLEEGINSLKKQRINDTRRSNSSTHSSNSASIGYESPTGKGK